MASVPPPDRPTEPLRRVAPAAVVREPLVAPAVDPNALLLRLQATIDSLRTGLALVGVLAVGALAVAIYALANDNGTASGGPASNAQVAQLQARVDKLSAQVQSRPGAGGTASSAALSARVDQLASQLQTARPSTAGADAAALGGRVAALEKQVSAVAARPTPSDPTQAIAQLTSRVDTLTKDVAALTPPQGAQ